MISNLSRSFLFILAFSVTLFTGGARGAFGEAQPTRKSDIRVQGKADVIVTEPTIRLADVAVVESAAVSDDEAMIELRNIALGASPQAGESKTLQGIEILEKMKDAGVRLDSLVYTLPRQIKVTRAYREVNTAELEKALKSFLAGQDREIEVKHLVTAKAVKIPADSFGVEVVRIQPIQPGQFGIDYRSRAGSDEVRFQMRAIADEWRVMPVAARALKKGELISASDVQMSKVNATVMGSDSIEQIGDVVGRAVVRDVGQGQMFTTASVVVPPVITAGSRVTMMYRYGRLEAAAVGVALESGAERQEIKVRNESSKKIVGARVIEKGVVQVGAQ
jgi:flagella basal body P-ring formation protein FlgA